MKSSRIITAFESSDLDSKDSLRSAIRQNDNEEKDSLVELSCASQSFHEPERAHRESSFLCGRRSVSDPGNFELVVSQRDRKLTSSTGSVIDFVSIVSVHQVVLDCIERRFDPISPGCEEKDNESETYKDHLDPLVS